MFLYNLALSRVLLFAIDTKQVEIFVVAPIFVYLIMLGVASPPS